MAKGAVSRVLDEALATRGMKMTLEGFCSDSGR